MVKRTSACAVTVLVTVSVGVLGGSPANAGPSGLPPPGLVADRVDAAGTPQRVPVARIRQTNPVPGELGRRRQWERQDKQESYVVDVDRLARAGPGPTLAVDPVTLAECDHHRFPPGQPTYWHKNHYSSCWAGYDNLVKPPACPIFCSGSVNSFRVVMIGVGDVNTVPGAPVRTVRYVVQTRAGDKGGPEPAPDATPVTVNVECFSLDQSTCASSAPQGITRSLGDLRDGELLTFDFTVTGPALDQSDPDAKTYHNTRLRISQPNPDYQPTTVTLRDDAVRCDLSSYNVHPATRARDNGACIFTDVDAYLSYSRAPGSPVKAVADHIALAQTRPEDTKPGGVGKIIPGSRDSGRKLTRLVARLSADRAARAAANRATAVANCRRYWGPGYPAGGTKDCDEYPFASTYEGAAYNEYNGGNTAVSYSSMPLDRAQNRSAGYALRLWYVEDHILERDGFYVVITS